jgi:hypothetical protein
MSPGNPMNPQLTTAEHALDPGGSSVETARRFTRIRGRGNVDYALRTVQQSLVHFSSMADAKANIMLTVCSIVVTLSVTQWDSPFLRAPMIALSSFSLVALVLAVLAAKPALRLPRGADGRPDPRSPGFNLFFFSHYSQLTCEEYLDAMDEMLSRDSGLYETIVRDIYGQGLVLARKKYRLLGFSYLGFLSGLGVSAAILVFRSF